MATPFERERGVEDGADLHPAEPEPRVGAHDAGAHRHDRGVGVRDVARHRERGVDRDGFVVAAERVPARDGGVEQRLGPQRRHDVGQRDRQAGAVGHHVGEALARRALGERGRDRRDLAVQRGGDHRHAVDRIDLGQRLDVLLAAADVGLDARVAALDDVAGPALVPFVAGEVPVHDVPPAGAEPELDRGGVHDHRVAEADRPGQLRERVRARGAVAEIDLDALQARALVEQPDDLPSTERRHRVRLRALQAGDQPFHAFVA